MSPIDARITIVARMERQIALCDLACNPGFMPQDGVVPHCALSRVNARKPPPPARTGVNALMLGLRRTLNQAPMAASPRASVAMKTIWESLRDTVTIFSSARPRLFRLAFPVAQNRSALGGARWTIQ